MQATKGILPKLFLPLIVLCHLAIRARAEKYFTLPYSHEFILISVQSENEAVIGKDTFDMEGLTHEIQERFWRNYLGTGKISIQLKVDYNTTPTAGEEKTVTTAIKKGLQNALTELCLQLHKKTFDELTQRQQDKIKKHFPALFQQKF